MTARRYSTETPGLVVEKVRDRWTVVHAPSGQPIATAGHDNRFPRLRDARAAAVRLAPLLDWTRPLEALVPLIGSDAWTSSKEAVLDALTDSTAEERDAARERRRLEATGEVDRERADAAAHRLGHELDWRSYGARSWCGTCRRCGGEVRVVYSSRQRRHELRGDAYQVECRVRE